MLEDNTSILDRPSTPVECPA
jgi:hypothetical protein